MAPFVYFVIFLHASKHKLMILFCISACKSHRVQVILGKSTRIIKEGFKEWQTILKFLISDGNDKRSDI